jgi:hypothetical protein
LFENGEPLEGSLLYLKTMNVIEEKMAFLNMFRGCQAKTPSKNGGVYFSFTADDVKVIESHVDQQSIGEFKGIDTFGKRVDGAIVWETKAIVDFSKVRDINNGAELFEIDEIIPLLKPLSALTREDCIELARIDGFDEKVIEERPDAVIANVKAIFNLEVDMLISPKSTLWLAMNGFDVLRWIEKGVAKELKQVA